MKPSAPPAPGHAGMRSMHRPGAFVSIAEVPFDAWLRMWLDYTAGQIPSDAAVHAATWERLREGRQVHGVVALDEGPVGFAHFHFHPSTWALSPPCYLQDLYVAPVARGRGWGRRLIEEVSRHAREAGSHVLHWNTRADNRAAIDLYSGLAQRSDRVTFIRPLGDLPT